MGICVKKTTRDQEEKQIKAKCGRRWQLWRERTIRMLCRGSSTKYCSLFKTFLAVSLHAFQRNKHGIEEHLI